jgi:hypothetical protein
MRSFDFTKELPVADIRIGARSHLRIYGFNDIAPALIELRGEHLIRPLHLTVQQAEDIAIGLIDAVARARSA